MRLLYRTLQCGAILALLILAGCGGGAIKQRIFAPSASVQELRLGESTAEITLRLQNYSNVGMTVSHFAGELSIAGAAPVPFQIEQSFRVPAQFAEPVKLPLVLPAAATDALEVAARRGSAVSYRLTGTITTAEPKRRTDEISFDGRVAPVPGLDRVFR